MPMKHSRLVVLASLLSVVAVLAGCGGGDEDAPAAEVLLRFLTMGTPDEVQIFKDLAEEFRAANPSVRVRVMTGTEYLVKLQTLIAADTPPDVFPLLDFHMRDYVDKGVLLPLGEMAEADPSFDLDDFYPLALEAMSQDGVLYAIPRDVTSLVVFYNKSLFDEAGVAYPSADWDWDELVEKAKALTVYGEGGRIMQYGFGTQGASEPILVTFVRQNGGAFFDEQRGKFQFDHPAVMGGLQFLADLINVHRVAPGVSAAEQQDPNALFTSGKLAMYLTGRWNVPTFAQIRSFEWDVCPPAKGVQSATGTIVSGYMIPKGSPHREEAWQWVKFLTGVEGLTRLTKTGLLVPSRKSIAESSVFLTPDEPPTADRVFLDVISVGSLTFHVPGYVRFSDEVEKPELEYIFAGVKSAREACPAIQTKAEQFLAAAGERDVSP